MQSLAEMIIEEEMNKYDIYRKQFSQNWIQGKTERSEKAHDNKFKGDSERVDPK